MEFFGRRDEIAELRRIRALSHAAAQFTVVTGRRRVGKTELVRQALGDGADLFVYLLVTRQNERTLVRGLQRAVEEAGLPVLGQATRVAELLDVVAKAARMRPVTLVIDEFQELDRINPSAFGEIQGIWDACHREAKLNLVVCGSVNRLMRKVFFNYAEPLYGRNTGHLRLQPFGTALLKEILASYRPAYTPQDLLTLWTLTGGVPRYVQLLLDGRAVTHAKMIEAVLSPTSSFLDEGRTILAEEFGADYETYFSVLSEIASGRTTFGELANSVGSEVGTCLSRLENEYGLIRRIVPLFDREKSRNTHYALEDCFLRFWFRFVFKYRGWIELGRLRELQDLVRRDFPTFTGYALERYFHQKLREETSCTALGGWWDRKGENEIDLVCEDEPNGTLDFYEVKVDAGRFDASVLDRKIAAFLEKNPRFKSRPHAAHGLSLKDM